MLADARDEVHVDRDAVTRDRVLADERCCDVLHPVGQPARYRPGASGAPDGPFAALPFEFADLGDHHRLRFAHDVAAVGAAVILDADGHSAVPVAVGATI